MLYIILIVIGIILFVVGYFLGKKKENDEAKKVVDKDLEKKVNDVVKENEELMKKIEGLRIKNDK